MKRLILLFLLLFLLSGCAPFGVPRETQADPQPEGSILTLQQELEQARQVTLELGIPQLKTFAESAMALRDQGLDFLSYGMPRQASYCFSFAGANVSALRLAAQQMAGQTPEGFSDWDTVAAISYASPVPFWCEAIAAQAAGDTERAQVCRKMAGWNVNTVSYAEDLQVLTTLSQAQLEELIRQLIAYEQHLYWFYPADPTPTERMGLEWSPEYHLNVAAGLEALGYGQEALEAYQDALAQDPFSPELFLQCAKAMYQNGQVNLMRTYLEEGLLMDPEHPGLNTWYALLWAAAGDETLAKKHLDTALAGELSEEDGRTAQAVLGVLEGG